MSSKLPAWWTRAEAALGRSARAIRVLDATAPSNLHAELARLEAAWGRGEATGARFEYAPRKSMADWQRALSALAAGLPGDDAMAELFAGRAAELALEAGICDASGTARLWSLARERYAGEGEEGREADALAAEWLAVPPEEAPSDDVTSDDEGDPRSLVARLREEMQAQGLGFRVEVSSRLSALAATGDGVVLVAAARRVGVADVERTVVHEIEGHVWPRVRALRGPLGILRVGTRGASDDQEGRALAIEEARGFLTSARRRELALRHEACRAVEARADFVETTRRLLERGAPVERALRVASRAHRGGGLGREIVYLPALCRVRRARAADASIFERLGQGNVSLACAGAVERLLAASA